MVVLFMPQNSLICSSMKHGCWWHDDVNCHVRLMHVQQKHRTEAMLSAELIS